MEGPQALRRAITQRRKEKEEIIIDAATQDNLSTIASAVVAMEMKVQQDWPTSWRQFFINSSTSAKLEVILH